jgi:hypothetical protein
MFFYSPDYHLVSLDWNLQDKFIGVLNDGKLLYVTAGDTVLYDSCDRLEKCSGCCYLPESNFEITVVVSKNQVHFLQETQTLTHDFV